MEYEESERQSMLVQGGKSGSSFRREKFAFQVLKAYQKPFFMALGRPPNEDPVENHCLGRISDTL